jgi:hypothetical protein
MKKLQSMMDYIKGLGKETYEREHITPDVFMRPSKGIPKEPVNKEPFMRAIPIDNPMERFSPDLRKMIDAMAYRESKNGEIRINKGDQEDGSDSYGRLHMGQDAVDMWNKMSGENLRAKDLEGPESDAKQDFIQASRIDRDMRVNKRDLRGATRYIQNWGEPNYATSSWNDYETYLNSLKNK